MPVSALAEPLGGCPVYAELELGGPVADAPGRLVRHLRQRAPPEAGPGTAKARLALVRPACRCLRSRGHDRDGDEVVMRVFHHHVVGRTLACVFNGDDGFEFGDECVSFHHERKHCLRDSGIFDAQRCARLALARSDSQARCWPCSRPCDERAHLVQLDVRASALRSECALKRGRCRCPFAPPCSRLVG